MAYSNDYMKRKRRAEQPRQSSLSQIAGKVTTPAQESQADRFWRSFLKNAANNATKTGQETKQEESQSLSSILQSISKPLTNTATSVWDKILQPGLKQSFDQGGAGYEMFLSNALKDQDVINYYRSMGQNPVDVLTNLTPENNAGIDLYQQVANIKRLARLKAKKVAEAEAGNKDYQSFVNTQDFLGTDIGTQEKVDQALGAIDDFGNTLESMGITKDTLEFFRTPEIWEDGYDFGDVTGTILGTSADLATGIVKGAQGVGASIAEWGASGVADIAELLGDEKTASRIRKNIENNYRPGILENFDSAINGFFDKTSVSGRTTDAIAQGVGQMWANVGAYAINPALGKATTWTSAYGNAYQEALQGGAEVTEARNYAALSATIETAVEKFFGGMGKAVNATGISKGIGGIDDILAKKLTSKISNTTLKNLAQYGIKASGEGLEEVLSGIGNAYAKKFTYMTEEDVKKLLADENLLESFVVGTLSSAIGQGGDLHRANKTGRDFTSGLTADEETVVNKVYEDALKEAEANGEKLSAKKKNELYEATVEGMKKGYISTDIIEEVLAGDTEVSQRVKDSFLSESYRERDRRSQKFQADVTQYQNEYAKKTVQNIMDSGIVNNTNRTHDLVDLLTKISADKNLVFTAADAKKLKDTGFAIGDATVNGYYTKDGIAINISSPKALNSIVGHEVTHALEGTEFYDALKDTVIDLAKTTGEYDSHIAALRQIYSGKEGYTTDFENKVTRELVSDLIGDYVFSDTDFIRNLSVKNRNLFQKVYDEIKYLSKMATAGSKEARALEKVMKRFAEAYRETKNTAQEDGVKFSLIGRTVEGDGIYKSNYPENTPKAEKQADLISLVQNVWSNNPIKLTIVEDAKYTEISAKFNPELRERSDLAKIAYGNKKGNASEKRITLNLASDLYQIASESRYLFSKDAVAKPNNPAHDGVTKFHYFVTNLVYKENENNYIPCHMNIDVKRNADGDWFYSFGIEKGSAPQTLLAAVTDKTATLPNTNVLQNTENVNKKLSLSDDVVENVPAGGISGKDVELQEKIDTAKDTPQYTEGEKKLFAIVDAIRNGTDPKAAIEAVTAEQPVDIRTVKERNDAKRQNYETELLNNVQEQRQTLADYDQHIAELQQKYDSMKNHDTVTANKLFQQIERQKRLRNNVEVSYSKRINDLSERIEKMNSEEFRRAEQRQIMEEKQTALIVKLIGDTSTWKDKKHGLGYMTNTLKRNLRDVVRDANGNRDIKTADRIYEAIQGWYNRHEAELNRELTRIRKKYSDLKITKAEDVYIQMLGEYRHNPSSKLTEDTVSVYYEKHKKHIDSKKVDKVIEMARKDYDSLIKRVNDVLKANGMKEIPYRQGYFPHFTQEKQNPLAKLLNWKTRSDDIPTDIAGLTEQFEPVRSYQSFNKQRTTDITDYSFTKGFDQYSFGAMDWIYHIEDIQKRRALENYIRYVHSDEGVKARIDAIKANEEYDADEAQEQIDLVYKEARNPLNNFVIDLRRGTQTLAGKKSSLDREVEYSTNRKIYSTMTNISNRVSANMVAGSISAVMTNFIPITQSWGEVKPISSVRAMYETMKSAIRDDGVVEKSSFLTNRLRKADNLNKTTWDKISDGISLIMNKVDNFTSQTVWRSKFNENMDAGMSEAEAIRNADNFAEGVMAGRSRGNMPTVFDSKNPLIKLATAFQLEVNNQYGYMFKDMPQDLQEKSKAKLIGGYAHLFLGAYAYNALYSALTGRTAAFDPIRIVQELLQDMGVGDDEEDEEIPWSEILGKLTENVLQEVPFVGGFLGGGRVPISSALPYDSLPETLTGTVKDIENKDWANLTQEWLNPVYYLLTPMGGGQIKKSIEGISMFTGDKRITGNYTTDGKLRYPVEPTVGNVLQSALFGKWSGKNAQAYIEQGQKPLSKKQTSEFDKLNIPILDYWAIKDKLSELDTLADKAAYINSINLNDEQRSILMNGILNRKEDVDMGDFRDFVETTSEENEAPGKEEYDAEAFWGEYQIYCQQPEKYQFLKDRNISYYDYIDNKEEYDYAYQNPEKYDFLTENDITVAEYKDFDDEEKDAWSWAYKNQEDFATSQYITKDVVQFRRWMKKINNIRADKDKNGNSISGTAKQKKIDYLNGLKMKGGQRIILYKMVFPEDDTYNQELLDYLNKQKNMTFKEKKKLLKSLGFTVKSDGTVTWD